MCVGAKIETPFQTLALPGFASASALAHFREIQALDPNLKFYIYSYKFSRTRGETRTETCNNLCAIFLEIEYILVLFAFIVLTDSFF